MLDLVTSLSRTVADDDAVAERVIELVRAGRIHFTGIFRDVPAERLFPEPSPPPC